MSFSSSAIWQVTRCWRLRRVLVLDPQAASPLLCRRLCLGRRCIIEGATAAVDITIAIRNGGVSLLWRTLPRGILRFRISRPEATACRGSGRSPPAARSLGGELPGEFRKPRRAGGRGDRTHRRPRPRCHAPLRAGASARRARTALSTMRRIANEARRPLLRGTRFREDRVRVLARRPVLLPALGGRLGRCDNSRSCIRTSKDEKPRRRSHEHDRGARRTPGSRHRDQSLASRVGRDGSGKADRQSLMRTAIEHAGAERGLLILLRGDQPQIAAEASTRQGKIEVTLATGRGHTQ